MVYLKRQILDGRRATSQLTRWFEGLFATPATPLFIERARLVDLDDREESLYLPSSPTANISSAADTNTSSLMASESDTLGGGGWLRVTWSRPESTLHQVAKGGELCEIEIWLGGNVEEDIVRHARSSTRIPVLINGNIHRLALLMSVLCRHLDRFVGRERHRFQNDARHRHFLFVVDRRAVLSPVRRPTFSRQKMPGWYKPQNNARCPQHHIRGKVHVRHLNTLRRNKYERNIKTVTLALYLGRAAR